MRLVAWVVAVELALSWNQVGFAGTLEQVRKRGQLHCGVSQGLPGFSSPDAKGQWRGIDVEFCHAVASAVLGDSAKVVFKPLSSKERFTALQTGKVDLLSRNTTWTFARDSSLGLDWVGVTYYDGQGFMVRKSQGITSVKQLNEVTICANISSTTELNIEDYFKGKGKKYKLMTFEKTDETLKAYESGRCDAYSTDQSGLYALRLLLKTPEDHKILPEIISKEPLGPVVRHGDNEWSDAVRWTLFVMLNAEELGITSKNIDSKMKAANSATARMLGLDGKLGSQLNLKNDWAYQVIRQVGNYEEVFERNLGQDSPLKIARGLNRLWIDGGLHYPMPIR
ncbi:amino acid ABC transporter substrate-binding protein [Pseudobacteriovorax antillogorgiicola]|uniref:General L-amino acid transport system substrate-binding protein n=1 Tax=Pseudobacteriovorax antillogorgiicola TaxID=1513793 RepID=A0A1Y6B900_9BACT|nr:amino acid ABC transporter substrate-binding protein [Pseudobacteriovorax antillogorgiicola]TCS58579.1 general L-amino acid transport system substrate-binding protein [Pseudobacteriovorax antillogorgiicola]SME97278.1 general L-amino acid transport system substrate-binding protein [Pseudobacteriovorax antillogorgiicola]